MPTYYDLEIPEPLRAVISRVYVGDDGSVQVGYAVPIVFRDMLIDRTSPFFQFQPVVAHRYIGLVTSIAPTPEAMPACPADRCAKCGQARYHHEPRDFHRFVEPKRTP